MLYLVFVILIMFGLGQLILANLFVTTILVVVLLWAFYPILVTSIVGFCLFVLAVWWYCTKEK